MWRFSIFPHHLRGQLVGAMLLFSLAPLVLVAYQGIHCSRQAVVALTSSHLTSQAGLHNALVRRWLDDQRADIHRLAVSRPIVAHLTGTPEVIGDLPAVADITDSAFPQFEEVRLFDAEWRILGGPESTIEDAAAIVIELGSHLEEDEPIAFGSLYLDASGSYLAPWVSRVTENDRTLGFLSGSINVSETLFTLIRAQGGPRDARSHLIAPSGLIVNPDDADDAATNAHTVPGTPLSFSRHEPGVIHEYRSASGSRVLGVSTALPLEGWMLITEQDTSAAYRWLDVLLWRAVLTFLGTFLVVSILAIWLANRIGWPLRRLAEVAYRIRQGRNLERIERLQGAEAEEVGRAFNAMLDTLREKQGEVARQAALASVGEMSSRIVHEVRNPLSSIKMNLQALVRSLPAGEGDHELAAIASDQVDRLEGMLNNLLQYARPLELVAESVPAAEMVGRSLSIVENRAKEKEIRIVVDNAVGDRPVTADPDQMSRALSNLLINAVQASPPRTDVCVYVGRTLMDDGTIFEVRDSGGGVSPEAFKRLFQPFFSTKAGGVGLGLANVKKIAEFHGGSVEARNGDRGAVFRIVLPDARAAKPEARGAREAAAAQVE